MFLMFWLAPQGEPSRISRDVLLAGTITTRWPTRPSQRLRSAVAVATHQLGIPLATPCKVGETWVVPQLRWGDDGINPAMNLVSVEMSWDVLSGYYEWHLSCGPFRSLMILSFAVSKLNDWMLMFGVKAVHFWSTFLGMGTIFCPTREVLGRWEVATLVGSACARLCQDSSYCFCEVWSAKSMVSRCFKFRSDNQLQSTTY